jgi:hypothetical protein
MFMRVCGTGEDLDRFFQSFYEVAGDSWWFGRWKTSDEFLMKVQDFVMVWGQLSVSWHKLSFLGCFMRELKTRKKRTFANFIWNPWKIQFSFDFKRILEEFSDFLWFFMLEPWKTLRVPSKFFRSFSFHQILGIFQSHYKTERWWFFALLVSSSGLFRSSLATCSFILIWISHLKPSKIKPRQKNKNRSSKFPHDFHLIHDDCHPEPFHFS